jgi:homoserine kinase
MNTYDKRQLAYALAKEAHGDNAWAALWGSASVLLSDKDLDVIIKVMENK